MKKSLFLPLLLASALSVGVASLAPMSAPAQVVQTMGAGQIDWTNGQITVTGTGAAPNKAGMSAGQKRLMAQRAAVADAYRQLAELINGVNVDSETIVKDFVTESDVIRTRVSALIKGAKPGKPRYMSDGTVEVDVTLGVYGNNSLSAAMVPHVLEKKEVKTIEPVYTTPTREPSIVMPTPTPTAIPTRTPETSKPVSGSYTGVIIDARGLGISPAMSPQIKDNDGKEIYIGDRPIDPDLVVNIGIVGYANSLDQARGNARIGNNPLVIKAVQAGGRHKTDAVVSAAHGQQILQADSKSQFLRGSKVIFVIDK
ncbi:MAG: LPP20 family lipoprotein [Candidatus Sericytochromatia bacterium]|nr:LPP20 family lipoprotein [Candidatus Sericytochromatia bacterium]